MTVLLEEDDPDVRSMLEGYFEKLDRVALDVAENGSEALGLSVSSHYDLILLDLHLPDIGGLDILPVLRGKPAHCGYCRDFGFYRVGNRRGFRDGRRHHPEALRADRNR